MVGTLIEPLVAALPAWLLGAAPMRPRQWGGALLLGVAMGLLARRARSSIAT